MSEVYTETPVLIEDVPGFELTEIPLQYIEITVSDAPVLEYVMEGPQGPVGGQGPPGADGFIGRDGATGPAGPPGPAGGTYIHVQGVAADAWTVQHDLGFYPNVTVIDSAGSVVEGDVTYLSMNDLTITFSASFSGRATLT